MKKVFTLLVAVLIAATTFAQFTPRVVKDRTSFEIGNKEAKAVTTMQKGVDTQADFWFNFADALEAYWGMDLDGFSPPILCDTNGRFAFSSGNAPVQFMSFGQFYDWDHQCWTDFYDLSDYSGMTIPLIGQSGNYSIDSLQLLIQYHWGTNVPTSVVDTVRISYFYNLDDEPIYQPQYYYDDTHTDYGPGFSMIRVPYNNKTYAADYSTWSEYDSAYMSLGNNAVVVTDDVLFDHETVTDSTFFYYFNFAAPAELSNLSCKRLGVCATFIPGVTRDTTSFIGTDINSFRTILYHDPRTEWNELFTEEILNDVQFGTFTDVDNFTESAKWFSVIQPNMFWQGNPKPYIGIHATCNDCAIVNVPEIDEAVATVYPNPATSVITVNTNTNEEVLVEMFNLVGQKVYSEKVVNSTKINVANMNAGVYMLKVNNHTTKVVVK